MEYRNAKMISDNKIECEINHSKHSWIPFTLDKDDTGSDIDVVTLHAKILSDKDYVAYVEPTDAEITAEKASIVRAERDYRLTTIVDPIVSNPLRWADMSSDNKTKWTDYRTSLLDITKQDTFPTSVTWPNAPKEI